MFCVRASSHIAMIMSTTRLIELTFLFILSVFSLALGYGHDVRISFNSLLVVREDKCFDCHLFYYFCYYLLDSKLAYHSGIGLKSLDHYYHNKLQEINTFLIIISLLNTAKYWEACHLV